MTLIFICENIYATIYRMTFICVYLPQHLLCLVSDVTCCVIFIMRFLAVIAKIFRAKVPMKLNVPDDDEVLIMH